MNTHENTDGKAVDLNRLIRLIRAQCAKAIREYRAYLKIHPEAFQVWACSERKGAALLARRITRLLGCPSNSTPTPTPRTDNYRSQGREWLPLGIFEDVERENNALRESLQKMLRIAEHGMPMPSHEGSCGPWAACDGNCESHAYCCEDIAEAQRILSNTSRSDREAAPTKKESDP